MKTSIWILCFSILTCASFTGNAQYKKGVKNLQNFDDRPFHFGFSLGLNTADFFMTADLSKTDSLVRLQSQSQGGFNLGIISDLHLHPMLSLRFIPTLSFAQRNLEYSFVESNGDIDVVTKPIESTYIDFPVSFKFRSKRAHNFAAYVVGGGMFSLDLASRADVDNNSVAAGDVVVKLKQPNVHYQVGVGFDFFLPYFKFSPEIKYSQGVNNVFIQDNTIYSTPIERIQSRIFMVSFNFEG